MTSDDGDVLETFSETTPLVLPDEGEEFDPNDPLLTSDSDSGTAPPPSPPNGTAQGDTIKQP